MKLLFTYPNNPGHYYIEPAHIGDGTYGMSYRVNELITGNYLAHNGLDPDTDLSQTWQTLTPELSKYINYFDDNKLITNLSQYDFWHTPLVVASTTNNVWSLENALTNYNEFGSTGNKATFRTVLENALWDQFKAKLQGLTGDWTSLNHPTESDPLYVKRLSSDLHTFELYWDSDLTDPVNFYWKKLITGITTTVTQGTGGTPGVPGSPGSIIFNYTNHPMITGMPVQATLFDGTMEFLQFDRDGDPITYYIRDIDANTFTLTTDAAGNNDIDPEAGPQDVPVAEIILGPITNNLGTVDIKFNASLPQQADASRIREIDDGRGTFTGLNFLSAFDRALDEPTITPPLPNAADLTPRYWERGNRQCFSYNGDRLVLGERNREFGSGQNVKHNAKVFEYNRSTESFDLLDTISLIDTSSTNTDEDGKNYIKILSGDGNILIVQETSENEMINRLYIYEWDGSNQEFDLLQTLNIPVGGTTYNPMALDNNNASPIALDESGDRFVLFTKQNSGNPRKYKVEVYKRTNNTWSVEATLLDLTYGPTSQSLQVQIDSAGERIVFFNLKDYNDSANDGSATSPHNDYFNVFYRSGTTWTNQNVNIAPATFNYQKIGVRNGLVQVLENNSLYGYTTGSVYDYESDYVPGSVGSVRYVNDYLGYIKYSQEEYSFNGATIPDRWIASPSTKCSMDITGTFIAVGGNNFYGYERPALPSSIYFYEPGYPGSGVTKSNPGWVSAFTFQVGDVSDLSVGDIVAPGADDFFPTGTEIESINATLNQVTLNKPVWGYENSAVRIYHNYYNTSTWTLINTMTNADFDITERTTGDYDWETGYLNKPRFFAKDFELVGCIETTQYNNNPTAVMVVYSSGYGKQTLNSWSAGRVHTVYVTPSDVSAGKRATMPYYQGISVETTNPYPYSGLTGYGGSAKRIQHPCWLGIKAGQKIYYYDQFRVYGQVIVSSFNTAGAYNDNELYLKTTTTPDKYELYKDVNLTVPVYYANIGTLQEFDYDTPGTYTPESDYTYEVDIGYPAINGTTGTLTEVYDETADGNTIVKTGSVAPIDFTDTAGSVSPHSTEQHPRYVHDVNIFLGGDKQFNRLDANGVSEPSITWTNWYSPGATQTKSAFVRPVPNTAFEATIDINLDSNDRIESYTLGPKTERGAYQANETNFALNLQSENNLSSSLAAQDDGTQWTDFGDNELKSWPKTVNPKSVNVIYNMPASSTRSPVGTKYVLPTGRYKWALEVEYPPLTEAQFIEMQAVANAVSGIANPFYFHFGDRSATLETIDGVPQLVITQFKYLWDNNTSSTRTIRFRKEEIDNNTNNIIEEGLKTFLVDGFEGDETNAFNAGEVIHLEDNINGGLNTVVNQVDSNVFGEARISIASPLEFDHYNGELIDKDPLKCVVTLGSNEFEYTKRVDGLYELKVTFNLDKFED